MAQAIPLKKGKDAWYIVLTNGNCTDGLMGGSAKYGAGSGDIAPLGSIHLSDVHNILEYLHQTLGWEVSADILRESEKVVKIDPEVVAARQKENPNEVLLDNMEMEQIFKFRSDRFCGPFSMFDNLHEYWVDVDPEYLESRIERFFMSYSQHRHKAYVATPNIHCTNYSCDPKSRDVRPMFYGSYSFQFEKMKKLKNQVLMATKSKAYHSEYLEIKHTNDPFSMNIANTEGTGGGNESNMFNYK